MLYMFRAPFASTIRSTVAVNKHNTARVASCWFIIYYILETNLVGDNQMFCSCHVIKLK